MTRADFWLFHEIRVRYSEVDAQAVVYNAHYLTYYDLAITEYFRAIEFDLMAESKRTNVDFHVAKALVEYKAPLLYDMKLEIAARITRLGRSSMTFGMAIFPKGEERLMASGEVVWVAADQTTHKSVPIAEELRARILAREPALRS